MGRRVHGRFHRAPVAEFPVENEISLDLVVHQRGPFGVSARRFYDRVHRLDIRLDLLGRIAREHARLGNHEG